MWRLVASVLFCWDPDLWGPWGPCAAWVPKGPQRKIVCPTPGQITSSCPPTTTTTALERKKRMEPLLPPPPSNYSLSSSTTWRANKWKNSAIWNWGAKSGVKKNAFKPTLGGHGLCKKGQIHLPLMDRLSKNFFLYVFRFWWNLWTWWHYRLVQTDCRARWPVALDIFYLVKQSCKLRFIESKQPFKFCPDFSLLYVFYHKMGKSHQTTWSILGWPR